MVSKNLPWIVIPFEILIFHGYVNMRKKLYTRVTIWVGTILDHIGTRPMLPRYIE